MSQMHITEFSSQNNIQISRYSDIITADNHLSYKVIRLIY